jgi:hypothetical protein
LFKVFLADVIIKLSFLLLTMGQVDGLLYSSLLYSDHAIFANVDIDLQFSKRVFQARLPQSFPEISLKIQFYPFLSLRMFAKKFHIISFYLFSWNSSFETSKTPVSK